MLASATEVEVELHVPDDVSTFFGVTWAQDPRKDKVCQVACAEEQHMSGTLCICNGALSATWQRSD